MLKRAPASASDKKTEKQERKDIGAYTNKQRTLVFSSRGINHRDRHFLTDLRDLLPHSKKDSKFDLKDKLYEVNEVADLKNCNNVIFFEARKHKDLYLWVSRCPNGPSAKFLVQNVHTMSEIKLTGNCLKGTRALLVFDKAFDTLPHLSLLKELFQQTMGSPKGHPGIKPFIDHVFSFFYADGRIWFRNYQIAYDVNENTENQGEPVLIEIGPRFVLNPVRIFQGSFGGATLWENTTFISPNVARSALKRKKGEHYVHRQETKKQRMEFVGKNQRSEDPLEEVFQ